MLESLSFFFPYFALLKLKISASAYVLLKAEIASLSLVSITKEKIMLQRHV